MSVEFKDVSPFIMPALQGLGDFAEWIWNLPERDAEKVIAQLKAGRVAVHAETSGLKDELAQLKAEHAAMRAERDDAHAKVTELRAKLGNEDLIDGGK